MHDFRICYNLLLVGSKLSWCTMDFFSCLQLFKHTVRAVGPAWCPTDLQHLCCKVLINKNKKNKKVIKLPAVKINIMLLYRMSNTKVYIVGMFSVIGQKTWYYNLADS